jgi:alpha-L-rhamnosidase
MHRFFPAVLFLVGTFPVLSLQQRPHPNPPTGLMVNLLSRPELSVITDPEPNFSWIVNDVRRGAHQTAYQIQVAESGQAIRAGRSDVWDSGRISSGDSVSVAYRGRALRPNTRYWWRVRTWDGAGKRSSYSEPRMFVTGDFTAVRDRPGESRWIEPDVAGEARWVAENRLPIQYRPLAPREIVEKGAGHYFVDFGRAAYATLLLTLTSNRGDRTVEVRLGEKRGPDDSVDPNPGASIRYRRLFLPLLEGTHSYTIQLPRQEYGIRMPPHMQEVVPYRYCEILGSPSSIAASDVRQLAVFYPFDDNASSFYSSDKTLNDVWEFCKYSIKATNSLGIYIDGDRERKPYEADTYIDQLGHYCVDREYALARYSHEFLIFHPTWPTEWILQSVLIAWTDFLYTGDSKSLVRYYDDLKAKTLELLEREDGLIVSGRITPSILEQIHLGAGFPVGQRGFRDIVDWPETERDGFDFRPVNTVVNAFHYRALVLMSKIAESLGKRDDASHFRDRAAQLHRSFNEVLLDPVRGVYRDGEGTEHASLHASMFSLACDLVPAQYRASVLRYIESKGMACSVYGAQWLLEGLYEAGEARYALDLMTSRATDRSWPHMIYDVGSTISLEAWDRRYKPNLDWNHAWGAAPANIIMRKVVGIEPLEPGFRKVRIRPQTGRLDHISGRMPTIRGTITVEVDRRQTSRFLLRLTVPANMTAEIHLPGADPARVSEGGRPVNQAEGVRYLGIAGGQMVFAIGSGSYEFTVGS